MGKVKTENKEEKIFSKMYIGPTIERAGLANGTVIIGDIKILYGNIIKEIPELENLFVDVDKNLALKKRAIFKKGTNENYFYGEIKERIAGGK